MNNKQQYQLASFRRVQDYLTAHADVVGALNTSEARTQLDAAVTQLVIHGGNQGTSILTLAGQSGQVGALFTALKDQHMKPLAVFARAKLRGVPDFAALSQPITTKSTAQLVQRARAMATTAAPYADAITRGGLPATTLTDLATAANALDTAAADWANTRVARVVATKGISEQVLLGREAVNMLDAVLQKQLASDPTLLAGWRAARRVVAKPGVARGTTVTPVSVTPPATSQPIVTSAAVAAAPVTSPSTPEVVVEPKAA